MVDKLRHSLLYECVQQALQLSFIGSTKDFRSVIDDVVKQNVCRPSGCICCALDEEMRDFLNEEFHFCPYLDEERAAHVRQLFQPYGDSALFWFKHCRDMERLKNELCFFVAHKPNGSNPLSLADLSKRTLCSQECECARLDDFQLSLIESYFERRPGLVTSESIAEVVEFANVSPDQARRWLIHRMQRFDLEKDIKSRWLRN